MLLLLSCFTNVDCINFAGIVGDSSSSVQPDQGGDKTMLWKRIRHTVVFGGKINKQKKEKE